MTAQCLISPVTSNTQPFVMASVLKITAGFEAHAMRISSEDGE
jgi:hypothetical protein